MPGRVPAAHDLPSQLCPQIIQSAGDPVNAVIFLHGLGDTSRNFASFARALNLPETLAIALQGPQPLPFPLPSGYHWGDDFLIDNNTGEPEFDSGFEKAVDLVVTDVICKTLLQTCNFMGKEILLFGFGQGGMLALAVARKCNSELAGVISIGGPIPSRSMLVNGEKCETPALLLGGRRGLLTDDAVKSIKGSFRNVESHRWENVADTLPQSRKEALPMMQFFARRLRSRQGVPKGSVEIS